MRIWISLFKPVWRAIDADETHLAKRRDDLMTQFTTGTFPVAYSAACILILLTLLILIGRAA